MKKTVVFDFDGVIHKYSKGWQDGSIYDEPTEGIKEALEEISKDYTIAIVSTRCKDSDGIREIQKWLEKHDLAKYITIISAYKPPAIVYIDDRAITFKGNSKDLKAMIDNFKPWNYYLGGKQN